MNKTAFHLSLRAGMALDSEIARFTKWDRKQYFYPDLPKGYQISQYDLPFCQRGKLEIPVSAESDDMVTIRINRVHLEEDAGKNIHDESGNKGMSQVDLNRAGTPLMEIVSEPDMRSAFQAKKYLEELRLLMIYLGVSDCNMQEGSLRCDANVNLHIPTNDGSKIATPIVEIKNMNSFRNVEAAIEHEAARQYEAWQRDGKTIKDVPKQTRGWNAEKCFTFIQREKEEAADYRYFPDPDLLPIIVSEELLEEVKKTLVETPQVRRKRYISEYQLNAYDTNVIIDQGRAYADYYEEVANICGDGKQAANWLTQDIQRVLNEQQLVIGEFPIAASVMGHLLKLIKDQVLSVKNAREVFTLLLEHGEKICDADIVNKVIQEKGLALSTDTTEIDKLIKELLPKFPKVIEDVRQGKTQATGVIIGQVVKVQKGANPATVKDRVIAIIGEMK
jgi:aspartyl-tRNA(Asn)/glutamyl-tRNA(Gln) amidotransferase subunit B